MNDIINDHPTGTHPFAVSLTSVDGTTTSGVAHRKLEGNGHDDVFLNFMAPALFPSYIEMRKKAQNFYLKFFPASAKMCFEIC